ncbi:MAG: hypothetical protein GY847_40740 [Proteobacteria bacterium]|nr:hypothetical protein [Pseudomonadota bacterium]
MFGQHIRTLFIMMQASVFGCSFALDFDSLDQGTPDTDTGSDHTIVEVECIIDPDCDDSIDCTEDKCDDEGACSHVPDNEKCEYLEMCNRENGCVNTGKECRVGTDCDDEVDCTVDVCTNGACYNNPDDTRCINTDNLCLIGQTCVATVGCTIGKAKDCDQSDAGVCGRFVCNPTTGECQEELTPGADNDEDDYLDVECGGDDCADTKSNINPGMKDLCNLIDDNCDGLTDMTAISGPVKVQTATDLHVPTVAYDGQRYALTWQRGAGSGSSVHVRILGTGECLVDTTCDDKEGSKPASDSVDLTPKGGTDTTGLTPSITAGDSAFYATWISKEEDKNPNVVLIGIGYDEEDGTPSLWDEAKQLSSGSATEVFEPRIAWNSYAADWIAAWGSVYSDDTLAVELIDKSMLDLSSPPFRGDLQTGEMKGLNLTSLDRNDCVIAYSIEDTSQSISAEIFEERLGLSGGTWSYRSGWPRVVSNAEDGIDDPSYHPTVTRVEDDKWVTGFTDVRVPTGGDTPEEESDIRGVRSESSSEIVTLYADKTFDQTHPSLAYDGTGFGLIYTQDVTSGHTLDFRLFDSSLTRLPEQGGRLARMESGEIRSGDLIVADSRYATVWIESQDSEDDALYFVAFEGCTLPEK